MYKLKSIKNKIFCSEFVKIIINIYTRDNESKFQNLFIREYPETGL